MKFDFEMVFANTQSKYPTVSVERAEQIYQFLTHDHTEESYIKFLRSLNGEEYFFSFDVEYLLHKQCIERMKKIFKDFEKKIEME